MTEASAEPELEPVDRCDATQWRSLRTRSDFRSRGRLRIFGCSLLIAIALADVTVALGPAAPQGTPENPLVVQINYDVTAVPGTPQYEQTLANIGYPAGHGPTSMGFDGPPLPLQIYLRGGNSNKFGEGELQLGEQPLVGLEAGFVSVNTNMPLVGPVADYTTSQDGAALLTQYLRANADEYRIDPERVMVIGRSFGGVVAMGLAYKEDYAQPGSTDPVLQQSSRPNLVTSRIALTSLICFSDDVGAAGTSLSTFFFPGKSFDSAPASDRLEHSPFWWVLNPGKYGRTETPPICLAYNYDHNVRCGVTSDVHAGLFGDKMWDALGDHARAANQPELVADSFKLDTSIISEISDIVVYWEIERMSDTFGGLYLIPPIGSLSSGDADLTFVVYGAEPGAPVSFFDGTQAATFPLPGCPGLEGQISDFQLIGEATAGPTGVAQLIVPTSAALLGQHRLFHAVDFQNCEESNVWRHLYQ